MEFGKDAVRKVRVGLPVWNAHLMDEVDDLVAGQLVSSQVQLCDGNVTVREGVDQLREAVCA